MSNYVDLSALPKTPDNKISWDKCNHNKVRFRYRNVEDILYVEYKISKNHIMVSYNKSLYELPIISLQRATLGKLFNFGVKNNYHYNVGEILHRNLSDVVVENHIRIKYGNKTCKGYMLKCLTCCNSFEISEANLDRGDGCSYCSGHKVTIGKNDLWTTNPVVAKMLKNPDNGYRYAEFSNQLATFRCPICGKEIGEAYIHNVSRYGLSCPSCSDGISYPNKLMYNLLTFFGEQFKTEQIPVWCKFKNYNDDTITFGIYDFIIYNRNLIIEMDGGIGHGNNPYTNSKYTKEELIYRDNCKDKLAKENGFDVIRINCNYSNKNKFVFCKNSILNSRLTEIYDFSTVDWDYINQNCLKSYIVKAIEMYNSGSSIRQISEYICKSESTVKDYIAKGTFLRMCV